ncbi:MAG: ABC transporter permease [Oscillospiraceae bacterium]|nr:ABC transporter permease [Oscillospiraceae bacterium]
MQEFKSVPITSKILRSKAFMLIVLLVMLVIVFTLLAPLNDGQFFKATTLQRILSDIAIPACLTIGVGLLIVSGGIDLSAAKVGGLSAVVISVNIVNWGMPWWVGVLIALVISSVIGLINAVLVNELGFMPFIATMAMSTVADAILRLIATDSSGVVRAVINFKNDSIDAINKFTIFGLTWSVVLLLILFIVYGLLLSKSKFGRQMYFVGGNRLAARLAGINSKRVSYFLFINTSFLAGLGGFIYTTRVKNGGLTTLMNDQFTGMTAAILGGVSFGGGAGGLGGALVGLIVIRSFNQGMVIIGASPYLTSVLSGVLLLVALSLDYFSQRRQAKRVGA